MDETLEPITYVDESAFWHTNLELNYGYLDGEVVEVEHGINKYWLAQIIYSYKNLVLLSWVHGEQDEIGEFWVDTSNPDCIKSGCSNNNNSSTILKRLFPLGHHLQTPLKFQYVLEKPKPLVNPTLYDPSKDPYANVKNVDDLLNHEIDQSKDVLASLSSNYTSQAQENKISIANSVAYGQEDVDELETALQNLNDQLEPVDNQDDSCIVGATNSTKDKASQKLTNQSCTVVNPDQTDDNLEQESDIKSIVEYLSSEATATLTQSADSFLDTAAEKASHVSESERDQKAIAYCKKLQNDAVTLGRIILDTKSKLKSIVYYTKPRTFYESGGFNHDRLLVPGTILECCYHKQTEDTRQLHHWFVIVLKNQGGRLTLRWFACDQPKFKQGRLELKTIKSNFIREDDEQNQVEENDQDDNRHESDESPAKASTCISAMHTTFEMHYCDPALFEFGYAGENLNLRSYQAPGIISEAILKSSSPSDLTVWTDSQLSHLFNPKRLSLDVNRYCIKELLSHARWKRPKYLSIGYAGGDEDSNRHVLVFRNNRVKLIQGAVAEIIARDAFVIKAEWAKDEEPIWEFVYPYDTSYGILPLGWAFSNPDCVNIKDGSSSSSSKKELNTSGLSDVAEIIKLINSPSELPYITFESHDVPAEDIATLPTDHKVVDAQDRYEFMHEVSADLTRNITPDDILSPIYSSILNSESSNKLKQFHCELDRNHQRKFEENFTIMKQVEVAHPNVSMVICEGRIRKASYPLLWIQISSGSFTVLPFDSTNIFPAGWCAKNNHPLHRYLPPLKRVNSAVTSTNSDRKRRKTKATLTEKLKDNETNENDSYKGRTTRPNSTNCDDDHQFQDRDHLDLNSLNDKQLDIDYVTTERSSYITIYFNHKCFTGPSLSKGKICSLPQYVGPGPMRLVMEEVVTKLISVAYVPPRILNDLNSQAFKDLLVARNLTNTIPITFKAKYQKRVHREEIPVCLKLDDVSAYCNCMCEHLKCCYNLFGPNLYDGDDCPSHCRVLTKSNKFMKRALYYREKAKNGEFTSDSQSNNKKSSQNSSSTPQLSSNHQDGGGSGAGNNKLTTRPRYGGRDSFESVSSRSSRSELVYSRASSAGADDVSSNGTLKENLDTVVEPMDMELPLEVSSTQDSASKIVIASQGENQPVTADTGGTRTVLNSSLSEEQFNNKQSTTGSANSMKQTQRWKIPNPSEFSMITSQSNPADWTIEEVSEALDACNLNRFKQDLVWEGVDGSALLLLDKFSIREHFLQIPDMDYSQDEMSKLCRFVEYLRNRHEAFE